MPFINNVNANNDRAKHVLNFHLENNSNKKLGYIIYLKNCLDVINYEYTAE